LKDKNNCATVIALGAIQRRKIRTRETFVPPGVPKTVGRSSPTFTPSFTGAAAWYSVPRSRFF
jgi:hypothetical protein